MSKRPSSFLRTKTQIFFNLLFCSIERYFSYLNQIVLRSFIEQDYLPLCWPFLENFICLITIDFGRDRSQTFNLIFNV